MTDLARSRQAVSSPPPVNLGNEQELRAEYSEELAAFGEDVLMDDGRRPEWREIEELRYGLDDSDNELPYRVLIAATIPERLYGLGMESRADFWILHGPAIFERMLGQLDEIGQLDDFGQQSPGASEGSLLSRAAYAAVADALHSIQRTHDEGAERRRAAFQEGRTPENLRMRFAVALRVMAPAIDTDAGIEGSPLVRLLDHVSNPVAVEMGLTAIAGRIFDEWSLGAPPDVRTTLRAHAAQLPSVADADPLARADARGALREMLRQQVDESDLEGPLPGQPTQQRGDPDLEESPSARAQELLQLMMHHDEPDVVMRNAGGLSDTLAEMPEEARAEFFQTRGKFAFMSAAAALQTLCAADGRPQEAADSVRVMTMLAGQFLLILDTSTDTSNRQAGADTLMKVLAPNTFTGDDLGETALGRLFEQTQTAMGRAAGLDRLMEGVATDWLPYAGDLGDAFLQAYGRRSPVPGQPLDARQLRDLFIDGCGAGDAAPTPARLGEVSSLLAATAQLPVERQVDVLLDPTVVEGLAGLVARAAAAPAQAGSENALHFARLAGAALNPVLAHAADNGRSHTVVAVLDRIGVDGQATGSGAMRHPLSAALESFQPLQAGAPRIAGQHTALTRPALVVQMAAVALERGCLRMQWLQQESADGVRGRAAPAVFRCEDGNVVMQAAPVAPEQSPVRSMQR